MWLNTAGKISNQYFKSFLSTFKDCSHSFYLHNEEDFEGKLWPFKLKFVVWGNSKDAGYTKYLSRYSSCKNGWLDEKKHSVAWYHEKAEKVSDSETALLLLKI